MTVPPPSLIAHRRLLEEARSSILALAACRKAIPPRLPWWRRLLTTPRAVSEGTFLPTDPAVDQQAQATLRQLTRAIGHLATWDDERADQPSATWRGSMTTNDLLQVIRFIKQQCLSGRMRVELFPEPIAVWFQNGRIVHAVGNGGSGPDALLGIVDAQGWFAPIRFSFSVGNERNPQTITEPTTRLINRLESLYERTIQAPAP